MSGEFERILERVARISEKEALKRGEKRGEKRGLEKGLERGKSENQREVARNMLADGSVPLDKIAQFSGLTIAEVENLKQNICQ